MTSTRVPVARASSSDVSPAARLSSRASSRLPGAACARVGTRRQRRAPSAPAPSSALRRRRIEAARSRQAALEAIEGTQRGVAASGGGRRGGGGGGVGARAPQPQSATPGEPPRERRVGALYTTSASILGANKPWFLRPSGPIYQAIDVGRLRARNRETFPFFNAVDADLTPTSRSAMNVQFVKFFIFGVGARGRAAVGTARWT